MKQIAVILGVIMAVSWLGSCSKSGSTSPTDTSTPGPVPTATYYGVYIYGELKTRENKVETTRAYVEVKHGDEYGSLITDAQVSVDRKSVV